MSAISPNYEWPNCWIRGEMSSRDIEGDTDYVCTHPVIRSKENVEGVKTRYGGLMAGGGVDDFKTFCVPVDMHPTSLGEPSALVIEGQSRSVEERPQLLPSWRTYVTGLLASGQK